ncbi:hypothetical protein ACHAXR_003111, partial [Thalassiosira sp. AJA248-18]
GGGSGLVDDGKDGEDDVIENLDGLGAAALAEEDDDDNEKNNETETSSESSADGDSTIDNDHDHHHHHPKRPSPPKYVVALSPMEITVGGGNNSNETQKFDAGDVIFIEDTWWIDFLDENDQRGGEEEEEGLQSNDEESSSASSTAEQEAIKEDGDENNQSKMKEHNSNLPQHQSSSSSSSSTHLLPKPCSLEPDPAFAHPIASSTTLSQHFTQHFTTLLRRSTNPHPSFLPHHHQDLLLPILAQTVAAAIGGAASLALVLQLWRIIPGPIAVGFGSACLIGAGTWGFVWLGEEILEQWELWRERKRLERMMSEGWGQGG